MAEKTPEKKSAGKGSNYPLYIAIAIGVIIVMAFVYYSNSAGSTTTVPFSTFKSNLNNAARVSIAVTYYNESQYVNESPCFSSIIQVIAHSRAPSTIDFFLLNQTSCTYSKTGLGGNVSPQTANTSYCLNIAQSEAGVFLNYSALNYTLITPQHIFIYGNSDYMRSCPIAVDFA